jgi:predicted transcriptional regulator
MVSPARLSQNDNRVPSKERDAEAGLDFFGARYFSAAQVGAQRQGGRRRMIKEEAIMTVRENVHQLVDTLPEDRLADVLDYLADLNDTDEVSAETKAAIGEGLEDIRAGRTITIEEYRRTRGL